ncbi:C2H2 type zinc-finger-domain-containing protein [Cristinia sonorae]|uniref:C2H2 type zinc-finger-domain-containing protein n=1 Tax=Cristinia sonorae TaxID=1940300 RepID=A0A8K0XKN7_9AGAR|nr:C2H2 type zinc-finger-domain-containing protein [Cristinia sonorae]
MDSQTFNAEGQQLFTCLSCSIAFLSADDQRTHYRSDHHRYNMKRRVAGLNPVSVEVFTQKVLERQSETAVMASPKGSVCETCGKTYTTENAYRSHLNSKKHKDNELEAQRAPPQAPPAEATIDVTDAPAPAPESIEPKSTAGVSLTIDADASEEAVNQTIDEKIAAARARISPTQCLFCPEASTTLEDNLAHMYLAHTFFVPDMEYIVDLAGLLTYLGEKIAVGNVCIYCGGTGREFRTLDAVRKHMLDKGHCKLAYESEPERLEVSDFYDFTSSYPDAGERKKRKKAKKAEKLEGVDEEGQEWEDLEEVDGEVDEVVDESASDDDEDTDDDDDDEDSSDLDDDEFRISYGDTPYELVLPSGTKIGHRNTLRHYTGGSHLVLRRAAGEDPDSATAQMRRLLTDKKSGLIPRKGGNFGAFGGGLDVIKARNTGEARDAGKHVRQYRDQARREHFKTKVGFRHNSQKHFRDPLLQV